MKKARKLIYTYCIDKDLHNKFGVKCKKDKTNMSAKIQEWVNIYLNQ